MTTHVDCKHCKQTGTCATGTDGQSCGDCIARSIKENKNFSKSGPYVGLICSVCRGKGITQVASTKWDYRIPAGLAFVLVISSVGLLYVLSDNPQYDKIIVFVSTLLGSVTGYYFGARGRTGFQTSRQPATLSADEPSTH